MPQTWKHASQCLDVKLVTVRLRQWNRSWQLDKINTAWEVSLDNQTAGNGTSLKNMNSKQHKLLVNTNQQLNSLQKTIYKYGNLKNSLVLIIWREP